MVCEWLLVDSLWPGVGLPGTLTTVTVAAALSTLLQCYLELARNFPSGSKEVGVEVRSGAEEEHCP